MPIDLESLKKTVGEALATGLKDLVSGAEEDLQKWGLDVANDLVAAAARGDEPAIKELVGQARMLAEIQRIKANKAAWRLIDATVSAIGTTLLSILGSVKGLIP